MSVVVMPEPVVTRNVTKRIVPYPYVTLRRYKTPGPVPIRDVVSDDSGAPEISAIIVNPFAIIVQITHTDGSVV
jgi:hypothetical protein